MREIFSRWVNTDSVFFVSNEVDPNTLYYAVGNYNYRCKLGSMKESQCFVDKAFAKRFSQKYNDSG